MTDSVDAPLASLDLLRQITDRHVVDQLIAEPVLTRAAIAAATGISKPTISESVRRLEAAGVLAEAGEHRSGQRGRAGLNYRLDPALGVAVAVSAGPDGLAAEVRDVRGVLVRRVDHETPSPVTAAALAPRLTALVGQALDDDPGPVRAATLSVAGPVDRQSGRLVHRPNSPFLVDELDARPLLAPQLGAEVEVDNDVNWAALAEHHDGVAADLDDFCYLHLGHGFGGAVVRRGELVRGHTGVAGEPAHMITVGPDGQAMRLVGCLGRLDLLVLGSDAIDVPRVVTVLAGDTAEDRRVRATILDAVAGVIASAAALLDPAGVVVGGPWLVVEGVVDLVAERVAELAVAPVDVRAATLGVDAPLVGARLAAVRAAQRSLLGAGATSV